MKKGRTMKKATGRKRVRFEMDAAPGSKVSVAGTFNDWDPTKKSMKDNPNSGEFAATLLLPPGRHEYKFLVNDEWLIDPTCTDWVLNDCGSLNSVMTV